jgi:hypothetical protein
MPQQQRTGLRIYHKGRFALFAFGIQKPRVAFCPASSRGKKPGEI